MSCTSSAERCKLTTGQGTLEEEAVCTKEEAAGGPDSCRDEVARGLSGPFLAPAALTLPAPPIRSLTHLLHRYIVKILSHVVLSIQWVSLVPLS